MSGNWYYSKDGTRIGPYDFDQLKQLALSGALQPTDKVWNEGATIWVPVDDVPGLMSAVLTVKKVLNEQRLCPRKKVKESRWQQLIGIIIALAISLFVIGIWTNKIFNVMTEKDPPSKVHRVKDGK